MHVCMYVRRYTWVYMSKYTYVSMLAYIAFVQDKMGTEWLETNQKTQILNFLLFVNFRH